MRRPQQTQRTFQESFRIWLEELSANGPVVLAVYVFLMVTAIILLVTFACGFYNWAFFENIMVEAHGMIFDLLVIGVFVGWLTGLGQRRVAIERYKEEIDDFLGWHNEEAMHRIVGNIKRLNRDGVTEIRLLNAYLENGHLAKVDLTSADLRRANLRNADLRGAKLRGANLTNADLRGAELSGADFSNAELSGAIFDKQSIGLPRLSGRSDEY
ncbi:MAG: pentapeptide repeat-containing protein [Anaerolineae bacterium]|nr:pentapeptide repeat-containing protein [Anaerolineae bacterium]